MLSIQIVLLILLSGKTTSYERADKLPACISQKIDSFLAQPKTNPGIAVYQYTYRKQTVYYVSGYCCDVPSTLYDSNCNVICSPDGGLTGKGDGKCPDFAKERRKEKLIWKDPRK